MSDEFIAAKKLPLVKKHYERKKWARYFAKDDKDITPLSLLNWYYSELQSLIAKDEASFNFWLTALSNCWLSYLYPDIYGKYAEHLKSSSIPFPSEDPGEIGFHPSCPMNAHVTFALI